VLATEAFDMAGDPSVFPAQLAAPVHVNETLFDGLRTWQPKKIYYFSDAQEQDQFKNSGPQYAVTGISSVRKVPYWRMAVEEFEFHLTQYRSYIEGLEKKDEQQLVKDGWSDPVQLTFGKSNVGGSVTGDLFEGVTSEPIAFVRPAEEATKPLIGVSLELAGPWGFYETFRREHGLQHLPKAAVPEVAIAVGATLQMPLLLRNDTAASKEVTLSITAPEGWATKDGAGTYTVRAGDQLPVLFTLDSPKSGESKENEIVCHAQADGQTVGTLKLHVQLRSGGLPQN
jgi:hypothetical protein